MFLAFRSYYLKNEKTRHEVGQNIGKTMCDKEVVSRRFNEFLQYNSKTIF